MSKVLVEGVARRRLGESGASCTGYGGSRKQVPHPSWLQLGVVFVGKIAISLNAVGAGVQM